ncbi:L-lactate dehydrogenase complex protein LldG [Breznakibacter xylanolyticus]|uniref:L-lactate dehydrogenase complex protein LldG n=1 Tax=Breznakibacter xylanolyticus TaxID=990 RepID=A0A2W7NKI6_9BACT|nr:lactate utilization protein [Breznakibacter xylanolyticus]PZX11812.1 L-lactate dehydrogenase complex protein LldG [Breznakibacter xylanolyticus]
MNAREIILNKLRAARDARGPVAFPEPEWDTDVFPKPDNLVETFVTELTTIQGQVLTGNSPDELLEKLAAFMKERQIDILFCKDSQLKATLNGSIVHTDAPEAWLDMKAAITRCEALVARTGGVVVSSAHESGRGLNVFPPIHIVWANASQLVPFPDDAIEVMLQRYGHTIPSQVSFITGPSRTADIEKTLVMGAHGPKELLVLLNLQA